MTEGDILGHEPMGIVEAVGADVTHIAPGDRVVIPFNISCGHCAMCATGLQSQCETTQVREHGKGAALFGYTKLYGQVAGRPGRAPAGAAGAVRADQGARTARPTTGSSTSPTCCRRRGRPSSTPTSRRRHRRRARPRADRIDGVPHRHAPRRGRVIGIDLVPERLERARPHGAEVLDLGDFGDDHADVADAVARLTDGRGPDAVIDAVGMEAHGSRGAKLAQTADRAAARPRRREADGAAPASTAWRRCSWPSSSSVAAGRSRCRASTAA